MQEYSFSADQLRQLGEHGLSEAQVRDQIRHFEKGATPIRLNRPCTVGDGLLSFSETDLETLVGHHDREAAGGKFMKFVPASGAASRMFREWFRRLEHGRFDTDAAAQTFAGDIKKFAFYGNLEQSISMKGQSLERWLAQGRYEDVLAEILTTKGLNYGNLPKALLKFHSYPEGSRTALEEHVAEAVHYVRDREGICRLHFTVSAEHRQDVESLLSVIRERYERQYDVRLDIGISIQSSDTDTIAVDQGNRPVLDDAGMLILRPGGHGALLSNLNALADGDMVFLKNIDNIVPDHLKSPTILYKKVLGGYLVELQRRIYQHLESLAAASPDAGILEQMVLFCEKKLNIVFPERFAQKTPAERRAVIFAKMNRPIRVCGMVKNEGEPGGGPYWVNEPDGTQSLQIVEEFQLDPNARDQRLIWSRATHFNPVDLVCGLRDYRGRKHDLKKFVNQEAFCIVKKSEKGRDLRALEWPGFWNGSMADWITVFVEIPLATFNPVKTVYDLLRPAHQTTRPSVPA
jgi:hypothetical protein